MVLRELAVRLGLDVDAQSFAKGAVAVEVMKVGLSALANAAIEIGRAFVDNVKGVQEYGDELHDTTMSVGVAAGALQELRYAASLSNLSAGELDIGIKTLSRTMAEAAKGGNEAAKAYAGIGVKVKNADGSLRNADDVIGDISDKLAGMEDGAKKTALSLQFFGRSGLRLIPMLNEGKAGLEAMRQEARDLGLVMSKESIDAADELGDNMQRLKSITAGLWRGAIAPLLPAINDLVKSYIEWKKANSLVMQQRIREFVGGAIKVIKALGSAMSTTAKIISGAMDVLQSQWKVILVGMTAALAPFIVELVAAGIAATGTALGIAAAWTLAAAPFIAIGAAITGVLLLLDDLEGYKQGKDSLFGRWKKVTDEWLQPNSKDPWWLAAIKSLVIWMEKALGVADDLGLVAKKAQPQSQTGTASGDVEVRRTSGIARLFGGEPKITRDSFGNPNVELNWADRLFGSEVVAGPHAAPLGIAPNITQNTFHVTQQPGEDGEHFAQRVAAIVDSKRASENEASAAALPANY